MSSPLSMATMISLATVLLTSLVLLSGCSQANSRYHGDGYYGDSYHRYHAFEQLLKDRKYDRRMRPYPKGIKN